MGKEQGTEEVTPIKRTNEFDASTREQLTAWWHDDDEALYGPERVEQAKSDGGYRQNINLEYEQDGNVVGVAVGKCSLGLGYLFELIVDEAHRGQGIGTALLAEFEKAIRDCGGTSIALRAQSPRAIALYERKGWVIESENPKWFGGLPAVQMRKWLNA
jgi:ribosomal protein S18 acetylase RimI-like enzyme